MKGLKQKQKIIGSGSRQGKGKCLARDFGPRCSLSIVVRDIDNLNKNKGKPKVKVSGQGQRQGQTED